MKLLKVIKLGARRRRSWANYRVMQSFLAENSIDQLGALGKDMESKRLLELGAGFGGYSSVLCKRCRMFVASDLRPNGFFSENNIPFVQFDATLSFPFSDGQFDWVYCSSLIEHLAKPENMLKEIRRVLCPGGKLYLSFPPFHSIFMMGGHQFKPFHLLGEKLALKIFNARHHTNVTNMSSGFGNFPLFPIRIGEAREMLERSGFKIRKTYTRAFPINTARLPGRLKDLFTWHVCFVAVSP